MQRTNSAPAVAFAAAFLVALFSYEGPTTGYWDTYIAAPAMRMSGRALDFHLHDGSPAYDSKLTGRLPDDLIDRRPGGIGIASEDQRLGAGIVASPAFRAFGVFGFRALHALLWAAAAALTTLAALSLGLAPVPATLAGLMLACNPYSLAVNRLNANVFALPALAGMLWLIVERQRAPGGRGVWVLAGLLLGVLGGIRNECILLVPALAAGLLLTENGWKNRVIALGLVGGSALATLAPTLAWQRLAFGEWIIHASQYAGFEGYRPTFPHGLGPWRFDFNGLLNWPFHDRLVRTPHFPFPTLVLLPLVVVRSFGVLGVALGLVGFGVLARRRPAVAAVCALWLAPMWAMLSVQENWEELKMTYLVLLWPAAMLPLAQGVQWLAEREVRPVRRLGLLVAVTAGVWVGAALLGRTEAPLDARWYVRFPHAATNAAGFAELPPEKRWAWEFFHSAESPSEVARERGRLVPPRLLPGLYQPLEFAPVSGLGRMAREVGTDDVRTLAIWKYIYTPPEGVTAGVPR